MSKVTLPDQPVGNSAPVDREIALTPVQPSLTPATPATLARAPTADPALTLASAPARTRASGGRSRARRNERSPDTHTSAFHVGLLAERLAPARNVLTIASLAIVAMAGTMWSTDRAEPLQVEREVRPLVNTSFPVSGPPSIENEPALDATPIQEMRVAVARNEPAAAEIDAPMPEPEQPVNEGIIAEDGQSAFDSNIGGEMSGAVFGIES
jgi:hypothetical protein